jgi:tetratricopeptide (TPR) repeat protein
MKSKCLRGAEFEGLFTAITRGFFVLSNRLRVEKIILPTFVLAALVLSGAAYARNAVWKDETSLWEDVAKKSPNKARPHNNLGVAYRSEGLTDMATEEFKIVLRLAPDDIMAHYNLALIYLRKGNTDMAQSEVEKILTIRPDLYEARELLKDIISRRH